MELEILSCRLEQTCGACPEQYDVFFGRDKIGYLRLRHGTFRADYIFEGSNDTVFTGHPIGDGIFASEDERSHFLKQAVRCLIDRHLLDVK